MVRSHRSRPYAELSAFPETGSKDGRVAIPTLRLTLSVTVPLYSVRGEITRQSH
jgi:hypothetical protein